MMGLFMNKKGNLLLTFILLIAIAAVLFSFTYIITGRVKESSYEFNRTQAFYIAEAGVNKAVWYLITPTGLGGQGNSYRVTASMESFGGGDYRYTISDASSSTILITCTGETGTAKRTIQQKLTSSSLPAAFYYAVYSNGGFNLTGNSTIKGPLFANGNITIQGNSNHPTGETDVSSGHTATVNGKTIPTTIIDPAPAPPTLNTTFYDSSIATAKTQSSGNKTYSNLNLNGGTVYVNGNATISGNVTGGGTLVVTGTSNFSGNITVDPNTTIITNKAMTIAGNTNFQTGTVIYSATSISDVGNNRYNGSIMAPNISITGNDTVYGFLYSWGVSVSLTGNLNIYGAVVNPSSSTYTGNIKIEYDPSYLPSAPPGLSSGGTSLLKGSWKEL